MSDQKQEKQKDDFFTTVMNIPSVPPEVVEQRAKDYPLWRQRFREQAARVLEDFDQETVIDVRFVPGDGSGRDWAIAMIRDDFVPVLMWLDWSLDKGWYIREIWLDGPVTNALLEMCGSRR